MIRFVSLILFSSIYLYGAGFWTLSNITKANIYISNNIASLNPDTLKAIKQKMLAMLKKENIKTEQQDSPILIVNLQEIENDENHYIYIRLSLGEQVKTFRENKPNTFAYTFDSSDFIETDGDDMATDILESMDYLLSEFQEQYKDDLE